MNAYDIGDRVRLECEITDLDGAPADADTITAKLMDPLLIEFNFDGADVTHDGLGEYHADFTVTDHGIHTYRFEATGGLVVAEETWFFVKRSAFGDTGS